jgi:NMD protein affecting ribosome stability and mRNA decay
MFCTGCGKEIPSAETFCEWCDVRQKQTTGMYQAVTTIPSPRFNK